MSGAVSAACVIFYSENPRSDQASNIRCPVLGLYTGENHRITYAVHALAEAISGASKAFEHHAYPGALHALFDTRTTRRPEAA